MSRVFCISRPVAREFNIQLGIISVHVVLDRVLGEYWTDWHAVYGEEKRTKAQIIRWSNAQFIKRLVRLGAFHTAMSFLGCIGKRFRDAGLQDILIESEVVAIGSINGVISGKHYNRADGRSFTTLCVWRAIFKVFLMMMHNRQDS